MAYGGSLQGGGVEWGFRGDLGLACYTQEEIGEREGVDHKTVGKVLGEMAELPKVPKAAADHLTDFDPQGTGEKSG